MRSLYDGETALLVDVRNSNGELVADHVWQSKSEVEGVGTGDRIMFRARIVTSTKAGGEKDKTFSCVEVLDSYSPIIDDVPAWDMGYTTEECP